MDYVKRDAMIHEFFETLMQHDVDAESGMPAIVLAEYLMLSLEAFIKAQDDAVSFFQEEEAEEAAAKQQDPKPKDVS